MRILGAARVSTKRQAGDERKSLPYQQRVIAEYAERVGGELLDVLVFAESGHKASWRKELDGIKDAAKRLKADVVVTSELDRLARRQHWQGQFVEDLDRAGVRYVAILDDLDTGREGDRVKLLALGMVSEIFVMGLRRKVRAGMLLRAEQGKPNARTPYGYQAGLDGTWEPDPLRAPWVPRVYALRVEGHGIPAITRHLKKHQAPPPVGSRQWYEPTVRDMLRRPAYAGRLVWGAILRGPRKGKGQGVEIPDAVPALVDAGMWDQVQRLNQARHRARSRASSPYLLAGLVFSHCGCGMHGGRAGQLRNDGTRPRAYRSRCDGWREGHRTNSISAEWLEGAVMAWLQQWVESGGPPAGLFLQVQRPAAGGADVIGQQLADNRSRLSRLEDMFLTERISPERYDLRRAELEAEHTQLCAARELALSTPDAPDGADLLRLAAAMEEGYRALRQPPEHALPRWKVFLQQHIARIEIGPPAPTRRLEDREIRVIFRAQ